MTDTRADALVLIDVSKRFGAATVLDDVSVHVRQGREHALLGENGAGKTTLMRIAYGMVNPDTGTIQVQGRPVNISRPAGAIGIGMVHQHFTLVPALTVAENLALGGHGLLRPHEMEATVRGIADLTGFALDPSTPIETLSVSAQQRVEIAKALVGRATILVFDEPTSVLAPAETEDLLKWMRRFADAGNSVVLITHKLTDALSVADDVTVLRRGRVTHTGLAAAASARSLTAAMIGHDLPNVPVRMTTTRPDPAPAAVLAARDVTVRDERGRVRLRDATLLARAGEIVAVAGARPGCSRDHRGAHASLGGP